MRALLVAMGKFTHGSLAATRALGQANWTVGIASPTDKGYAAASRWATNWHRVPSQNEDLDAFLGALNQAIDTQGYEVVFGAGDSELFALSYLRDRIKAVVPYAPHERVIQSFDKVTLAQAACDVGMDTPRTVEASDAALASFGPRCVIKSRLHWQPERPQTPMRQIVHVASSHAEARKIIDQILASGGEPLIQEYVDGELFGVTALTDKDSRTIAQIHQEAPLTWRPAVGMPARARTVAVDPILADKVAALLKHLGWFGLVQLQFMVGSDGRQRLIDFNGRTYASLALSTAAGVNFKDLWARLATDREIPSVGWGIEGIRYQWVWGDLRRALVERRGGLARDLLSCLGYAPGAVHPLWMWRDPKPFLRVAELAFDRLNKRKGSAMPRREAERSPPDRPASRLEETGLLDPAVQQPKREERQYDLKDAAE